MKSSDRALCLRSFSSIAMIGLLSGASCTGDDAGKASKAPTVSYSVPTGGGKVVVALESGNEIQMQFPASASGKEVSITPRTSADIGWTDGRFVDVVELSPAGLQFSEPILIRSKESDLIALHVQSANGTKTKPELLPLAPNGAGLELSHFSAVAFVRPSFSCDSANGWVAGANAATCQDVGSATTQLVFQCSATPYCFKISASCCVAPDRASDGCRIGDAHLTYSFSPEPSASASYPWCSTGSTPAGTGGGTFGAAGASTFGGATTAASFGGSNASGGSTSGVGSSTASGGTTFAAGGMTSGIGGGTASGGTNATTFGTGGTNATTIAAGGLSSGGTSPSAGGASSSAGGTATLPAGGSSVGTTSAVSAGGAAGQWGTSAVAGAATAGASAGGQGGTSAAGGGAGVANDGCFGWTSTALPAGVSSLRGVAALSDSLVVAVGSSTAGVSAATPILATQDAAAGAAWSTTVPASGGALRAVWATGANSIIAVGDSGTVLAGTYSSGTWNLSAVTGTGAPVANLYTVWGIDAQHFWVAGANSAVYYYDGTSNVPWVDHTIVSATTPAGSIFGMWGTSATDLWVVRTVGSCPGNNQWHYANGAWTEASSSNGCYANNALWGASGSDIWSVGYSKGTFSHFTGNGWSAATSYGLSVPLNVNAIRGRSASNIWAVGDGGNIAVYDGVSWKMCTKPVTTDLYAVDVSPSHVWAVGTTIVHRGG